MNLSTTENNNKARPIMENTTLLNIIEANEQKATPELQVLPIDVMQIINFAGIKYTISIGTDSISHNDSRLDKLLFALRNADQAQVVYDVHQELVKIMVSEYIKFGFSHVESILADNMPIKAKEMFEEDNYISTQIMQDVVKLYNKKEAAVSKHIGTNRKNIVSKLDNSLVVKMLVEGGVYVVNAGMGEGKTQNVTKPAFDMACDQGLNPIGISPKRILSSAICNDERHYSKHTSDKGLFGVINSVVASPRFKEQREKCRVLICEEHEENVSQAVGKAVGKGSINERSELLAGYYDLMKSAKTVIIADATMSEDQIKVIEEKTGRTVTVVSTEAKANTKTVKLLTEAENVARAAHNLINGQNVINFSDASNRGEKSKFNEIYHALAANRKATQVTANSLSEMDNKEAFIENIESELAGFQYAQVSPVINSGVSFHSGHFNSVHVMLNEVIPMKSAIQVCGRVRDAEVINLSLTRSNTVKTTSVNAIIASEMISDKTISEVSDDLYNAYTNNSSVITMADIIAKENMMRIDYESNLIIALRLMGYKVEIDSDDKEAGNEIKKAGREIEAQERVSALVNANDLTEGQYKELESAQYVTNAQKFQMAKYEMKQTYVGVEFNEDLIAFDKKGERRGLVENNMLASGHKQPKTKKGKLKQKVVEFLFSTLRVNANTFTGEFSKLEADAIVDKFASDYFKLSDYNVAGKEAFELAFNTKLPKGHSTTAVAKILAKFGIKTQKTGQKTINGKRVNMYTVSPEMMNQDVLDMVMEVRKNIEAKTKGNLGKEQFTEEAKVLEML